MNDWMKNKRKAFQMILFSLRLLLYSDDFILTNASSEFSRKQKTNGYYRTFRNARKVKGEEDRKMRKIHECSSCSLPRPWWWCESIGIRENESTFGFPEILFLAYCETFVGLLRSVDVEPSSPEDLQAVCSIERYGRGVAKISVCVGVWAITPPPGLIAVH